MLGHKIKLLRNKKRLKRSDLADRVGVSRMSVYRWETDSTTPTAGLIRGIAKALDTTPNDLLGYDDTREEAVE